MVLILSLMTSTLILFRMANDRATRRRKRPSSNRDRAVVQRAPPQQLKRRKLVLVCRGNYRPNAVDTFHRRRLPALCNWLIRPTRFRIGRDEPAWKNNVHYRQSPIMNCVGVKVKPHRPLIRQPEEPTLPTSTESSKMLSPPKTKSRSESISFPLAVFAQFCARIAISSLIYPTAAVSMKSVFKVADIMITDLSSGFPCRRRTNPITPS